MRHRAKEFQNAVMRRTTSWRVLYCRYRYFTIYFIIMALLLLIFIRYWVFDKMIYVTLIALFHLMLTQQLHDDELMIYRWPL